MKTILIFLLLAATASAQVIVDAAQGKVTGISDGTASMFASGGSLTATTGSGGGFGVYGGQIQANDKPIAIVATGTAAMVSGSGVITFGWDGIKPMYGTSSGAFALVTGGTSSVPGVTITSSNGVLFLGGTAANSSYLLSTGTIPSSQVSGLSATATSGTAIALTGTIAESQVTNLVSDLAGKQAAGSYLTNAVLSLGGTTGNISLGNNLSLSGTTLNITTTGSGALVGSTNAALFSPTITSGTFPGLTIISGTLDGRQTDHMISVPLGFQLATRGDANANDSEIYFNTGRVGIYTNNGTSQFTFWDSGPSCLELGANSVYSWAQTTNAGANASASDTGFSRISAGLVGVGTGAQGSFAGALKLTTATVTGTAIVGTPAAKVGGVIFASATNATSVGTAETDLRSDVLVANTFGANNECVYADYSGAFAGLLTTTPTLRLYFSGTKVYDSGAITISADVSYSVAATLQRSGSNTVVCSTRLTTTGASNATYTMLTTATATLTATNVLRFTGQSGGTGPADGDITGASSAVRWYPAP